MDTLLEVIKLTLPSIIVFFTAYFLVKQMIDAQDKKNRIELRKQNSEAILNVRLQAYERLILLMERLQPKNLVLRAHTKTTSSAQFHSQLLQTIRNEFDHNLSQQIYVSNVAWNLVKQTKEETIKLINVAAANQKNESKSIDLSKYIIEMTSKVEKMPHDVAIEYLKREIRKVF